MTEKVTRYRIFISSPGDVRDERDALETIISRDIGPKLAQHFPVSLNPFDLSFGVGFRIVALPLPRTSATSRQV